MIKVTKVLLLLGVILLVCNGLWGCKGGGLLQPESNLLPGNPNPGIVRVTLNLPFDFPRDEVRILSGLSPIAKDGEGWLAEVTPGTSQMVWAICSGNLLGMAIIIDSSQVADVEISPESTAATLLFMAPLIFQDDLPSNVQTWLGIHELSGLPKLAEHIKSSMVKEGIEYFGVLASDVKIKTAFGDCLLELMKMDAVREVNGNIVKNQGITPGFELVDKYWTKDSDQSDDLELRNFLHRYGVVISGKGEDKEYIIGKGKQDAPSAISLNIDYSGLPPYGIKVYTWGDDWSGVKLPDDLGHIIEGCGVNAFCGVIVPIIKILGYSTFEGITCSCGIKLYFDLQDDALPPEDAAKFPKYSQKGQVLQHYLLTEPNFGMHCVYSIKYLGEALINDFSTGGNCLKSVIVNLNQDTIKSLSTALGLPILQIYSFFTFVFADFPFLYDGYVNGKMKNVWTTSSNDAPIINWNDISTTGFAPLKVNLSSAALDPDTPLQFSWQMGNGDNVTGNNIFYSYDAPGAYRGKLTVTDAKGVKTESPIFTINVNKPGFYPTALYVGNNVATKDCIIKAGFHVSQLVPADYNKLYEPWGYGNFWLPMDLSNYDIVVVEDLPEVYDPNNNPINNFLLDGGGCGVVLLGSAPYYLETGQDWEGPSDWLILDKIDNWFGAYLFNEKYFQSANALIDKPFGIAVPLGGLIFSSTSSFEAGAIKKGSVWTPSNSANWDGVQIGEWYDPIHYFESLFSFRTENKNTKHRIYWQAAVDENNATAKQLLTAAIKWVGEKAFEDPCQADGNDTWSQAEWCDLWMEDWWNKTVCWSNDKEDWYWFDTQGPLSGKLELVSDGRTTITLFDDTPDVGPIIKYSEANEANGFKANINLDGLGLKAGKYYGRIKHIGTDTNYRHYTYTNHGICLIAPDETRTGTVGGPTGLANDKDDWYKIIATKTLTGSLDLSLSTTNGACSVTLFSEAQMANYPNGGNLGWVEANSTNGYKAKLPLNGKGYGPGNYYIRIRHIGSDQLWRKYLLKYNVNDISFNPVDVTPPWLNFSPCDVCIVGAYAYVAGGFNGLHIFNISNPTNPVWVNMVDTPGSALAVAVSGGYAYIADLNGFCVIDIEPPSSAYIVKTVYPPAGGHGVAISDGYAYVANGDTGLRIIDVEPPQSAHIVKTVDTTGNAEGVAVSGGYAYMADGSAGLQIIDIEPPGSAYIVKTVDTQDSALGVAVSGGYAYVADYEAGLQIIDIEPPSSAYIVKTVPTPGDARCVAVSGGYAYVSDYWDGLFHIIDIEPPSSAYIVKTVDTPPGAHGVAISDSYAYVASYLGCSLSIIDIEPPSSAYIVKYVDMPGYAYGVAISGGYAYVADWCDGLRIIKLW